MRDLSPANENGSVCCRSSRASERAPECYVRFHGLWYELNCGGFVGSVLKTAAGSRRSVNHPGALHREMLKDSLVSPAETRDVCAMRPDILVMVPGNDRLALRPAVSDRKGDRSAYNLTRTSETLSPRSVTNPGLIPGTPHSRLATTIAEKPRRATPGAGKNLPCRT